MRGSRRRGATRISGGRSRTPFRRIERALSPWERAKSWTEASAALAAALRALVAPSPAREALETMLEELGRLDDAGDLAGADEHARMVRKALDASRVSGGRFERDGVLLADVVSVRGLSFRAVVVAGMVERGFPVQGREDPILLDEERAALGGGPGPGAGAAARPGTPSPARLPPKGERLDEERLLFRLASDAGAERRLYTRARSMGIEERESLPSPFYREALERAKGKESGRGTATPATRTIQEIETHIDLLPPVSVAAHAALDAYGWALGEAQRRGMSARDTGTDAVAAPDLRAILPFLDRSLAASASAGAPERSAPTTDGSGRRPPPSRPRGCSRIPSRRAASSATPSARCARCSATSWV
jgi:hypothetical protein